ncbi:stage V sporulation protein B [Clostridia bacterium]|nr:stage V sporulation protein B [Clostridia bacterium]
MSGRKQNRNFLMQATILAAAGIIVRIIGMLYRSPLISIIGDEGNGYYSTAYNIYTMILLISSYSIPTAVSKLISEKLALKQYKNAQRLFLCSLSYVIFAGGIGSLFTFFFSPALLKANPSAVLPLKILAPTIFASGILGVLRGYFQAYHTMVPTSISQIIEQLVNAIVSILAAWIFTHLPVVKADPSLIPIYGAAGGALGTGAGVLSGFAFLVFVYILNNWQIQNRILRDRKRPQAYKHLLKSIMYMVSPIIFATFIYNISTSLDMTIFYWVMDNREILHKESSIVYGIFAGKCMVLINIPVALASAVSSAMLPEISSKFIQGELDQARQKISEAIHFTMLLAIPAALGLGVFARPVMQLLFPQKETLDMAASLLRMGCLNVIFYSLSTISSSVLQGIGKVMVSVRNTALALFSHIILLLFLLLELHMKIEALMLATLLYTFILSVLNSLSVRQYLQNGQDIKKVFLLPLFASVIMAALSFCLYTLLYSFIRSNFICLSISIVFAVILYVFNLILMRGLEEHDLKRLPKGAVIIRWMKKLKLWA